MNSDEFLQLLSSRLPSERMRAVQWANENVLTSEFKRVLVEAASSEGVPRIQAAISLALKRFDRRTEHSETSPPVFADGDAIAILDELSGIIRHETQPAIGWVRFAAHKEIEDFDGSSTNTAIEALKRRIGGVVNLAAAHRLPTYTTVSLSELLSACLSAEYSPSIFHLEAAVRDDEIRTDPDLMSLILSNAIQNAVEAVRDLPAADGQILISTNVSEHTFWLTISNRFTGASFEYSSVSATGRTSKQGHRGLGTRITDLAAGRLGYEFELRAIGATATFSLRGKRFG